MSRQIIFPKSFAWQVTLGVLFSLSISYSEDITVPVTVTNRTAHYLHVKVNDRSFTYVASGGAIRTEVKTDGVTIEAVYSPGQGKFGVFSKDYATRTTASGSCGSSSCSTTGPGTTPLAVDVAISPTDLR